MIDNLELIGLVFRPRRAATPAPAPRPATPVVPAGIPPAHVAAIAAAVAVVTDGRGRVVRVLAPPHGTAAWSEAGRNALLAGRGVRAAWLAGPGTASSPRQPRPAAEGDSFR
jgi:hypothetical protein